MENKITTLKQLLEAREAKNKAIDEINKNYIIQCKVGQVDIIENILQVGIKGKLLLILEQLKNTTILNAEQSKKEKLEKLNSEIKDWRKEKDSIIFTLSANLKDRKEVVEIKDTSDVGKEVDNKRYVAKLSDGKFQSLEGDEISYASRYFELINLIKDQDEKIEVVIKDFEEAVKDIEYVKPEFDLELKELRKISDITWTYLSDIDPEEDFIKFSGNSENFEGYLKTLKEIVDLLKKLEEDYEVYL